MSRMLSLRPNASWMTTTPEYGCGPSGRARYDVSSVSVLIAPVCRVSQRRGRSGEGDSALDVAGLHDVAVHGAGDLVDDTAGAGRHLGPGGLQGGGEVGIGGAGGGEVVGQGVNLGGVGGGAPGGVEGGGGLLVRGELLLDQVVEVAGGLGGESGRD